MAKPTITARIRQGKKVALQEEIEDDPRFGSVSDFLQTRVDEYLDERGVGLGDLLQKASSYHGGDNQ